MLLKENFDKEFEGKAYFSDDMKYRYILTRCWDDSPWINFIMLNPSNGDHEKLETTTKGVMKRAKAWGYGGMMIVNLFNLISTDPKKLAKSADPVGPSGDWAIEFMLKYVDKNQEDIVCAWGNHGKLKNRHQEVLKLLGDRPLKALAVNGNGMPRHPLHMHHSIEPEPWNVQRRVDT